MEVKIKQMEELSLQSCIKIFVWDRINFHCWKKNLLVTQSYYAFKVIEDFFFFFYVSGSCEEQVQTTSRSSLMLWRSLLPRVEILPGARWLYRYPYVITRHAKFHNASGMTYSFSFHTNCCFRACNRESEYCSLFWVYVFCQAYTELWVCTPCSVLTVLLA